MNVRKPRSGAQGLSLRDRLTEWREFRDGCERKPTRKRVHALRVVTLRIQSELEQELGGIPHASHEARAILRFGKQGERLRSALGTVREIDVWIGDLKGLCESMMETTGTAESYVPRTSRECVRGIERLEARLEKKRHTAEKKLIAEIGRRRGNLESAARRLADEWPDHQSEADPQAYERILIRFADIAKEYAVLSEENLHDFRKQIKTVR
jgi:CHAD domain-containing protein